MKQTSIIRSKPEGGFVEILPDGSERPYTPPETDWAALDALSDEEAEAAALADPDTPPLTGEQLERGVFGRRVRRVRQGLGLSQTAFAQRFRFSVASLRDWEQGRRMPDGATRAYLTVIAQEPEAVLRALAAGDAAE